MTTIVAPSHSFLATGKRDSDLSPVISEYTVAQAAQILDMSEGCVEELLDDNMIEYRQNGDERFVQRDSLLEFNADYQEGREAMAEITRMAQEMGLYD